jgi:hypothetical protein
MDNIQICYSYTVYIYIYIYIYIIVTNLEILSTVLRAYVNYFLEYCWFASLRCPLKTGFIRILKIVKLYGTLVLLN